MQRVGFALPDEVHEHRGPEIVGTAAFITKDGHSVAVSANLGYHMSDMALNYRRLWSTERSLGTLALGIVASHCAGLTLSELTSRAAVETMLLAHLASAAAEWGVTIVRFHLTDCVQLRAHRHYVEGMALQKGS